MATAAGVRALHHQDVTPGHTYRHRRRRRPSGPAGVTVQHPCILVVLQDGVGTDAEEVVQVDDLVPQVDASTTVSFGLGVFALGGVRSSFLVSETVLVTHAGQAGED